VYTAVKLTIFLLMVAVLMGCGADTTTTAAPTASTAQSYESDSGLGPDTFSGDPSGRWESLVEALQLTDDQVETLQPAFDEFRETMQALRTSVRAGELSREEAAAQREALSDEFEEFLQDVLTPEQYELWQELRDSRARPGHDGDRPGRGDRPAPDPEARWEQLAEVLGLSADQQAAITEAAVELQAAMQILREQVQSGEITREEAREIGEGLRAEFDLVLQEVLSAEQYEQLQELRENRPNPGGGGPGGGGPGQGPGRGGR